MYELVMLSLSTRSQQRLKIIQTAAKRSPPWPAFAKLYRLFCQYTYILPFISQSQDRKPTSWKMKAVVCLELYWVESKKCNTYVKSNSCNDFPSIKRSCYAFQFFDFFFFFDPYFWASDCFRCWDLDWNGSFDGFQLFIGALQYAELPSDEFLKVLLCNTAPCD